ncbi:hypothetical protein SCLCIDRAFT_1209823, partial [Scleroderma citrinum Foug A]
MPKATCTCLQIFRRVSSVTQPHHLCYGEEHDCTQGESGVMRKTSIEVTSILTL